MGRIGSSPPIPETYFVLGCTVGLFRSALDGAERLRWLPGPLAYLLSTAGAAVAADPVVVSVAVDGDGLFEGAARLVVVGGGHYRGSEFALLSESRPGDGLLHALAVEPAGLSGSVGLLRLARAGRLLEHPAVSYRSGERVTVEADATVPVELDGTPIERPLESATLSVVSGALSVAHPLGGT